MHGESSLKRPLVLSYSGIHTLGIATGYLHVATQTRVQEYNIPIIVTGPTIPISTYESDSNPSMWLLTATGSGIDLERLLV